jgi:putative aldouronate transport system substrate-binding protein
MNKKRLSTLLALAMTAVLSVGMFSGCKKDPVVETPAPTETTTPAPGESATPAPTEAEPGWKEDTSPITFDWYINFSWFATKWDDPTAKYVTEKTGVNINYIVPAGNEAEALNTMLASGSVPDLITLGWWEDAVKKMIEGDMVLPLNELADKYDMYFYKVADAQKLSWYKQADGNVYGYPNASSSPKDFEKYADLKPSNQTFMVRKDIYEAIGSPDMRTPEGFLAALKAAKEKFPEVNGQPIIPLGLHEFSDTGNYSLEGYLQNFLAIPFEKDGQLYDRRTDADYIKWLKTFRTANEQGLLSKDIFVDKRAQMEEKIAQGRYFAMIYQRSDCAAQLQALYAASPDKRYIAVDGPANSNLDAPKLAGDGLAGWTVTLISKDNKDPERAIKFLSYLISEEGNKDLFLGKKGQSYDTIDGKDQFTPEALKVLQSDRAKFDKEYGSSFTHWMLMDTNMQLQWAPPSAEPSKQLEDWTKGKTVSYALYDGIDPTGTSEEGVAASTIAQEWGKTLPKLINAKTEAEFDQVFEAYKAKRVELGHDKVEAFRKAALETNKKKLGM